MPFVVQIFIGQGQGNGSAVIPDATPSNAGVMTAAQAEALANVQGQVWAWKRLVAAAGGLTYDITADDTAIACDTSIAPITVNFDPSIFPNGKIINIYDLAGNCKIQPITVNVIIGGVPFAIVLNTAPFESTTWIVADGSAVLIALVAQT